MNTVSYHDEEKARLYGVEISEINRGFVIPEFKAVCRFTGKRIRVGTIEWVRHELNRLQISIKEGN